MPKLLIDMEARTASVLDALDAVDRKTSSVAAKMESSIGSGLKGFAAAAAGALSIGAAAEAFRNVVDEMAQLDDAAEKSGASVEELSAILNTLRPSGATLEQITDITGKLTRAMSGADQETSKAAKAFEALGIRTRDAEGNLRPVTEVLGDLAAALNTYADGTNKTALAQAILGKSGADALPLLKDLANTQRVAASVTTEQAAAAEELQKAWGRLKVESARLWQALASEVIPGLTKLIETFNEAKAAGLGLFDALAQVQRGSGETGKRLAEIQAQNAADAAEIVRLSKGGEINLLDRIFGGDRDAQIENLRKKISARAGEAQALQKIVDEASRKALASERDLLYGSGYGAKPEAPNVGGAEDKKAAISDGERLLRQLESQLDKAGELTRVEEVLNQIRRENIQFDSDAQRDKVLATATLIDLQKAATDEEKRRQEVLRDTTRLQEQQDAAYQREQEQLKKQAQHWEDVVDVTLKYQRQLDEINRLEDLGYLSSEKATQARGKTLARQFEELNVADKLKETDDTARQLGLTMESAFENAAVSARSFGDIATGILQDVLRIILRTQVTTPLASGLVKLFSGFGGSTYNTGGLSPGTVWSGMDKMDVSLQSAKAAPTGMNWSVSIGQVGANVTRADVESGVRVAISASVAEVMRQVVRNGALAKAM